MLATISKDSSREWGGGRLLKTAGTMLVHEQTASSCPFSGPLPYSTAPVGKHLLRGALFFP